MITKTFVIYDVSGEFDNPTTKEVNDEVQSITLDNLSPNTTYYVKAGVVQDGERIISETYDSFTTEADNTDYFYVENEYNGQNTFSLYKNSSPDIQNIEWSKDKQTWTAFDLSQSQNDIVLEEGEKLYLRNDSWYFSKNSANYYKINCSENYSVGGNINTLLNYSDLSNVSLSNYCFGYLFRNSTTLISAQYLLLPSSTLANGCYYNMFNGCSSLTTAPTLPATTLAQSCYSSMFNGCSSLTTAPTLPATTLIGSCYQSMFKDCTALVNAPSLPATTLTSSCYSEMFRGCSSLTTAPELPATTLADYCYGNMFNGCSSLTTAPSLPATTLVNNCYYYMFRDCVALVNAPSLQATTLANYCYSYMFYGCSSLTTAPSLPATTLVESCYKYMFYDCVALVNAPSLQATTLQNNCYEYMFYGCSSLVNAPELPARTLKNYCYEYMFYGCSSLNDIVIYANSISAYNCLYNWVNGVAATGTFHNLGSASYQSGVSGIPQGWTVVNN